MPKHIVASGYQPSIRYGGGGTKESLGGKEKYMAKIPALKALQPTKKVKPRKV